jgi:hypothetical protein
MKKFLFLTVSFLLFSVSSYGLNIYGITTVQEHNLVILKVADAPNKIDNVVWEVEYLNDLKYIVSSKSSNEELIFTGPPGDYKIRSWVIINGKGALTTTIASIKAKGVIPTPTPTPTPIVKNNNKLLAFAIFDYNNLLFLSPDQLDVKNSIVLSNQLSELNTDWRVLHYSVLTIDAKWNNYLRDKKYPLLVVIDDVNNTTVSYPIISAQDVIDKIKAMRGK